MQRDAARASPGDRAVFEDRAVTRRLCSRTLHRGLGTGRDGASGETGALRGWARSKRWSDASARLALGAFRAHASPAARGTRRARLVGAIALALLCAACAPRVYPAFEVERRLSRTLGAARYHMGLREIPEAAQLIRALERIDPAYPGIDELRAALPTDARDEFASTLIGVNRSRRVYVDRGLFDRLIWYLPDRLLDLLDVVSVEVHSGAGGYVDLHLTRGAQLSGGARVVGGLGILPQRAIPGFGLQANAGLSAFGVPAERFYGVVAGPGGVFTGAVTLRGGQSPTARIYQDYRDFWSIGASATVGFFGGSADIRPVQLVDLFLGFVGLDIGNDDAARTRPLRLLISEVELLEELGQITASNESLAEYRASRASEGSDETLP